MEKTNSELENQSNYFDAFDDDDPNEAEGFDWEDDVVITEYELIQEPEKESDKTFSSKGFTEAENKRERGYFTNNSEPTSVDIDEESSEIWQDAEDFISSLEAEKKEKENIGFYMLYSDIDSYTENIAELYSFSEVQEFDHNMRSFEELLKEVKVSTSWQLLKVPERQSVILHLINLLDINDSIYKSKAKEALLYIAQGCWKEVRSIQDQQEWTFYNVSLLMQNGVFSSVTELLYFEVEKNRELNVSGNLWTTKQEKNMSDSIELRLTLNLLYTMVETIRCNESLHSYLPYIKSEFSETADNKRLLATLLFDVLVDYTKSKYNSQFPIKKILLLLWKVILISLGGDAELRFLRKQRRHNVGLPPEEILVDDSCRDPGSYPISKTLSSDFTLSGVDMDGDKECRIKREDNSEFLLKRNVSTKSKIFTKVKVTQRELDQFAAKLSSKYSVDSPLHLDKSFAKLLLPPCIEKTLTVVKDNVHMSLADVQFTYENRKLNWPYTFGEEFDSVDSTETLYTSLVPNLVKYAKAVVAVLYLVAPSTVTTNISECTPVLPIRDSVDRLTRNTDATRHHHLIFKAVSAITLLLLKHTKVNHIFQFEYFSQQLVKAGAIQAFFSFFQVKSLVDTVKQNFTIERRNFPNCVLGNLPDYTLEEIRSIDTIPDCQRSILAYINTARILNKLTKRKPHRLIYMAKNNYHVKLSDALIIKEPTLERYVIKLLKMQTKYIKKNRSSSVLKILKLVYGKVGTNLTDEWITPYSSEEYQKVSSFSCSFLDPSIDILLQRYHWRKYEMLVNTGLFLDSYKSNSPVSNNKSLYCDYGEEELFKCNYERWLKNEVFENPIDWDKFLKEDFSYF